RQPWGVYPASERSGTPPSPARQSPAGHSYRSPRARDGGRGGRREATRRWGSIGGGDDGAVWLCRREAPVSTRRLRPVETGHVPPHDLEAEESVLGACLLSQEAILTAGEVVTAGDFYRPAHAEMFGLMMDLAGKGQPVDSVTLADSLRRAGKLEEFGGKPYLFTLVSTVPTPGSVAHYARIVAEHSRLRKVIDACQQGEDEAFGLPDDVPEALDRIEARVFDAVRADDHYAPATMSELADEALKEWSAGEREFVGLPTGLPDLDAVIGGLEIGDLITIGAATSVGKTSLACRIAREAVRHGPVLYVSLEMPRSAMFRRFLSAESGIDAVRLKRWDIRDYEGPAVTDACARLSDFPLVIDDRPQSSVFD